MLADAVDVGIEGRERTDANTCPNNGRSKINDGTGTSRTEEGKITATRQTNLGQRKKI